MTPEEHSKHLVNKFYQLRAYDVMDSKERHVAWGIAKSSAIICVKEIINIEGYNDGAPGSTYSNPGKYYWQQVLKHIEAQ